MFHNPNGEGVDFLSAMETFAEAWVAAYTHTPLTAAAQQGLINGPSNHPTSNQIISNPSNNIQFSSTLNHPVNNQVLPQPVLTVLQEPSPIQNENATTNNSRCNGMLSPNDLSGGSVSKPYKVQEVNVKYLPLHCVIEKVPDPQTCDQYIELERLANIPIETLFSDLVKTALRKLGYSASQMLGAKGLIKVKNWKPLAFNQITDNLSATVGDILGELATLVSLHIRLYSLPNNPKEWKDITVRNAVLELLREMSQGNLAKISPLSQSMIFNIINNRYAGKLDKAKSEEFGKWYLTYRKEHPVEKSNAEVVQGYRSGDRRLAFQSSEGLPVMREWFNSCLNTSRMTLQTYMDNLNQGYSRHQDRMAGDGEPMFIPNDISMNAESESIGLTKRKGRKPVKIPATSASMEGTADIVQEGHNPTALEEGTQESGQVSSENVPNLSEQNSYNFDTISENKDALPEQRKRKRNKKKTPNEWMKNVRKKRRNLGLEYVKTTGVKEPAKQLGSPCVNCRLQCSENFDSSQREALFKSFWGLGDINKQRDYICRFVERKFPARSRQAVSRRKYSMIYKLSYEGEQRRVCRSFFLNTLCLTEKKVRRALDKESRSVNDIPSPDNRGHHTPINKTNEERIRHMEDHIDSFPRVLAHWSRKDTTKEYLDPMLNKEKMYLLYKEYCRETDMHPLSKTLYKEKISEKNICFHNLKKNSPGAPTAKS